MKIRVNKKQKAILCIASILLVLELFFQPICDQYAPLPGCALDGCPRYTGDDVCPSENLTNPFGREFYYFTFRDFYHDIYFFIYYIVTDIVTDIEMPFFSHYVFIFYEPQDEISYHGSDGRHGSIFRKDQNSPFTDFPPIYLFDEKMVIYNICYIILIMSSALVLVRTRKKEALAA